MIFAGSHAAACVCTQQAKLSFCCCWVRWQHLETQAADPVRWILLGGSCPCSNAKLCQQSGDQYGLMCLYPKCKIALIWWHQQTLSASFESVGFSEAISLLRESFVFHACEDKVHMERDGIFPLNCVPFRCGTCSTAMCQQWSAGGLQPGCLFWRSPSHSLTLIVKGGCFRAAHSMVSLKLGSESFPRAP